MLPFQRSFSLYAQRRRLAFAMNPRKLGIRLPEAKFDDDLTVYGVIMDWAIFDRMKTKRVLTLSAFINGLTSIYVEGSAQSLRKVGEEFRLRPTTLPILASMRLLFKLSKLVKIASLQRFGTLEITYSLNRLPLKGSCL